MEDFCDVFSPLWQKQRPNDGPVKKIHNYLEFSNIKLDFQYEAIE